MALSELEKTLLDALSDGSNNNEPLIAVWTRNGEIEMGPVRWRTRFGNVQYSCSPFPGAWVYVSESEIVRVSHAGAMLSDDALRKMVRENSLFRHRMRHGCFSKGKCPEWTIDAL
jgi:hypothetical protein